MTEQEKIRPGFVPLVNAFIEWECRYRQNPELFSTDKELTVEESGERRARYIVSIMDEHRYEDARDEQYAFGSDSNTEIDNTKDNV